MSKKNLGQFYTTNNEYILQNLNIPDNINNIIEPFAGQGDLLNYLEKYNRIFNIECYDIDPKNNKLNIIKQDTLLNPPDFNNKFVITNPPYLGRNKSKDKTYFDKYDQNDLYKCFIKILIDNDCLGGILIIPLNFWTTMRKQDISLRKLFLKKYKINRLNIFEENVFDDTNYTICAFQFEYCNDYNDNYDIYTDIYPSFTQINLKLNNKNNYIIGGEIYQLKGNFKIERLTSKNKDKANTNILLKCLDDNENSKISLSYNKKHYIDNTPNLSARCYATLIIEPQISDEEQHNLIKKFNSYIDDKRKKYHSLFLTNYRESKNNGFARKRISFTLAYDIISYLLTKL